MQLKKYFLGLVFASLLCCGNSYAGHIIRKTIPAQEQVTATIAATNLHNIANGAVTNTVGDSKEEGGDKNHKKDTTGWEGIVALSCGILGVFTFGLTSIPAIIFGAIGLGKGKQHRGMSMAGLILGIVTIFLVVGLAVLISAFYL